MLAGACAYREPVHSQNQTFLALRECQACSRAPAFLAALSRPQRITVDMGFELTIAAKRDPTEGREPVFERGRSPAKTLTFHASGAFSHENGALLAEAIDDAIALSSARDGYLSLKNFEDNRRFTLRRPAFDGFRCRDRRLVGHRAPS